MTGVRKEYAPSTDSTLVMKVDLHVLPFNPRGDSVRKNPPALHTQFERRPSSLAGPAITPEVM